MVSKPPEPIDPGVYGIQVNDTWRCWNCGSRPPVLDNRWCSATCRKHGESMLRESPTPQEIVRATHSIRSQWTPDESAQRATTMKGEVRSLFGWLAM
jgi:hypothetical protein